MTVHERYNGLYHYNGYRTVQIGRYNEEHPIPSTCHLRMVETGGETVVIATELADNEGMSITNAYEWLASRITQEYELDPQRTRFIEHYSAASYVGGSIPDTYDEVSFVWNGREAHNPQWRRLQGEKLAALQTITAEEPGLEV